MSWIKGKQDPVRYLHHKMPDLLPAHIIHGWTDGTELVIVIPKTKGRYEKLVSPARYREMRHELILYTLIH